MPHVRNEDLPETLREHMAAHASDIYRAAFNNAWAEYATRSDREAVAHRVAWAAVKRRYRKVGSRRVALAENRNF